MSSSNVRQPGDIVNEVYSDNIPSLIQLCDEVGDDPHPLIEQVKHELQKMVTEMMAEDDALLERKRAELAPIRSRFESIFRELYPEKSAPTYASTLPVLPALRKYVDEHKKLKDEHEKLLQSEGDIRREERRLCHELNEISLENDRENFQAKQLVTQMSLLSEHIGKLKEEKEKRVAHLTEIVRTLNEYEEVYGWKRPSEGTAVGRLLALSRIELDRYPLAKESLDLVDQEFRQIVEQIQKAETEFEASHQQLRKLMRKHQSLVPNEKTLAMSQIEKCRISKLPDLVAEVDRYNDHAMEKLTNDILKARERIQQILTKLSIGDVTNDSKFSILFTSDFTDDIYFMHEELAQELEAQYEMNRSIYEQIERWNELFAEFQEFEKNASDPQRFHRRGYSALSEEKTRKKLEANLRECEHRLENLGEDFQIKNSGEPFRMNPHGQEILDYIRQRKDDYTKTKEREREAAKAQVGRTPLKVKQILSGTIVGKTPMKTKANLATSTLSKSKYTLSGSIVGQTPMKSKQINATNGGKTPLKSKGNL